MVNSVHVVNVGKKSIRDYVFEVIVNFQEGVDKVVIKGYGRYISKAVDLYNVLKHRLGDSIEMENVEIGSENLGNRLRSFIEIRVTRKF